MKVVIYPQSFWKQEEREVISLALKWGDVEVIRCGGFVLAPRLIQLDSAFAYQQAAISAVLRALAQSHGADFAAYFVHDHRAAILIATSRRLCGRDERAVASEAFRLGLAYNYI